MYTNIYINRTRYKKEPGEYSAPLFLYLVVLDMFGLYKYMFDLMNGKLPHVIYNYCNIIDHCYRTLDELITISR